MVKGHSRGHTIYFNTDKDQWLYLDDNTTITVERPCTLCNQMPTPEGYDACLGYIEGATSACCGHGIQEGIILYSSGELKNLPRLNDAPY